MPCHFIASTMFVLSWSFPAKAMSRQITPRGLRAMMPRKVSCETELTRPTIAEVLQRSVRLGDVTRSPQQFLEFSPAAIQKSLHDLMIQGIASITPRLRRLVMKFRLLPRQARQALLGGFSQ